MAKSNNNYIEYSSKDNMSQTYIGSDSVYTYNDKVTSDEEKVAMYAEGLGISGVMNKIILGESDEVDEFLSDSKYTTFYCIYNNGVVYYFVIDGDEVIQLSE
jgi:hypothetical protein